MQGSVCTLEKNTEKTCFHDKNNVEIEKQEVLKLLFLTCKVLENVYIGLFDIPISDVHGLGRKS